MLRRTNNNRKFKITKIRKYKELKNKKGTKEYEWFFLRYIPAQDKIDKKTTSHIRKLKKEKKKLVRKKYLFIKEKDLQKRTFLKKVRKTKRKRKTRKNKRTFKRLFGF